MRYINVNGRFIINTNATVPYNNRAFRYGYGLFETMLLVDNEIYLRDYHFERLFSGLEQLGLVLPELMTKEWIEAEIKRTVKKNKKHEGLSRVRFQVYAGRGGLFDGQNAWSEFVIECQPVDAHILQLNEKGLSLCYAEGLKKSNDSIANLKSCNAMIYSMAARQASSKEFDNAIIVNIHDNPIETTISNLFCIKNNDIYTPALSEGCIAGVMRRYVIEQLQQKGYTVHETEVTKDFLESAESVFATNAIRRIKWIESIEDKKYNISKVLEVYENVTF